MTLGELFPDHILPKPPVAPRQPAKAAPQAVANGHAPAGGNGHRPDDEGVAKPASNTPRNGDKRARICVSDLVSGQDLDCVYLATEAILRTAKNGSKYIQATVCDKTGSMPVRQWDASENELDPYLPPGYVRIRGRVEKFKNALQLVAFAAQAVDEKHINAADFIPISVRPLDEMAAELDTVVASIQDEDYRTLLQTIFGDTDTRDKFIRGPAAASVHHAWRGGLIEHVLSAVKTAEPVAAQRPYLNRDLLITGVILHDIGKIEEIDAGPGFSYTDTGRLCGHIVLGAMLVERNILKLPAFPKKKRDILIHMILSHHGELEYGSPVTPLTAEAVALHHLECMDAKVQGIQSIIERERAQGNDGAWSDFARVVDGRIYKG